MNVIGWLVVLAMTAAADEAKKIQEPFLLEEACNLEPGVVQHTQADDSRLWLDFLAVRTLLRSNETRTATHIGAERTASRHSPLFWLRCYTRPMQQNLMGALHIRVR